MSDLQSALGTPFFARPIDLGADFTGGLQAGTQAGKGLADAITYMGQLGRRSSAADGVLATLQANGMLDDKTYQAVAGKSTEAKEAIIGMFTTKALQTSQAQNQATVQASTAVAQGSQERQTQAA